MSDDNGTVRFGFTHISEDGDWNFDKYYEYGIPWDMVLNDFISFLSGIYGYDIRNKVKFETTEEKIERLSKELGEELDW